MNDDTEQQRTLTTSDGIPTEERLFIELSRDQGAARMAYEQMLKSDRCQDNDDIETELQGIGADKRMADALKRLSDRALELRNRVVPDAREQDVPGPPIQGGPETQEGSWRSVIVGNAGSERTL